MIPDYIVTRDLVIKYSFYNFVLNINNRTNPTQPAYSFTIHSMTLFSLADVKPQLTN